MSSNAHAASATVVAIPPMRLDPEHDALARALFGPDARLMACRGGRNSRVYRVDRAGERFALKFYPADGRGRVEREYASVSFFAAERVARVPQPVHADVAHNVAVYTWLDGEAIGEAIEADIDAMSEFAAELHALRYRPGAQTFGNAAEACYDRRAIIAQIDARLDRLANVTGESALEEFLRDSFTPLLAREVARSSKLNVVTATSSVGRTLSPSDFGLHNALRTAGGDLAFLDFEYFGWDDPLKLVCDVLWHPGMALHASLRARFVERCRDVYGAADMDWDARLALAYPLYGLRWCLIVLNEFLPAMWQRRVGAGVDGAASGVRAAQLDKAQALLERVTAFADGAAYGY